MKLLAPTDLCRGSYRIAHANGRKLWPICLTCCRLSGKATTIVGEVKPDAQGIATCEEVLRDGTHAAQSEAAQQFGASLPRGGVCIPITPVGVEQ